MDRRSGQRPSSQRAELLADVAEMYFLNGRNQAQIAKTVGVTRSMVSRMLSEARRLGIVEIRINRPLSFEHETEAELVERFGLRRAYVLQRRDSHEERLLQDLGAAGAYVLGKLLAPESAVGLAWGTAIDATVEAIDVDPLPGIKVVQLVGALGARNREHNGHALVQRLAEKLGGEAFYLNAPFLVDDQETAHALLANRTIDGTIALGRRCHIALVGVGSADPRYSSFYLAGYGALDVLQALLGAGAVGDVCGQHFDIDGCWLDVEFHRRMVAITKDDLLAIPTRIGVAAGQAKVLPILGALRGGFVNVLVTDAATARAVLSMDGHD